MIHCTHGSTLPLSTLSVKPEKVPSQNSKECCPKKRLMLAGPTAHKKIAAISRTSLIWGQGFMCQLQDRLLQGNHRVFLGPQPTQGHCAPLGLTLTQNENDGHLLLAMLADLEADFLVPNVHFNPEVFCFQ